MLVLAVIFPLASPSSLFAKRDNEPASSVSEQLQVEMVMERTEIGLGSSYQKEPILRTGKNSRKIKGG